MALSRPRSLRLFIELPRGSSALELLERLYAHVAGYAEQAPGGVAFEFHFRHRPAFDPAAYRATIDAQREAFSKQGSRVLDVLNVLHAPLELTDDPLADLCRKGGPFDALVLRLGLYEGSGEGGELNARNSKSRLVELTAQNIDYACEAVISRQNLARIGDVVRFAAEAAARSFRLVPLHGQPAYLPPYGRQDELSASEARRALERMIDLLVPLDGGLRLEPLRSHVERVMRHHDPRQAPKYFDRRDWEPSLWVDEDGEVRGSAFASGGEPSYGNLFAVALGRIIGGALHLCAIGESERRMASTCSDCPFFGGCDGSPIGKGLPEVGGNREAECTIVRPTLEYAEQNLRAVGAMKTRPLRLPRAESAPGDEGPGPSLAGGVRLWLPPLEPEALPSRIALSSGTYAIPSTQRARYHVAALAPRAPFRPPTAADLRLLTRSKPNGTAPPFRREADVALIRLPDRVVTPLVAICKDSGLYDGAPGGGASKHPAWAAATLGLETYLHDAAISTGPVEATVLYGSDGNLATVTKIDRGAPDREAYVGLHLDSWEGVPLRGRASVRNRIGINLSMGERYFLFVNLTLADMMRALGLDDAEDVTEVTLFAGHKFMRAFPDYPVVRLCLAPGEAYVGPTGNLVHDGASPEGEGPDVALHLLGRFGAGA